MQKIYPKVPVISEALAKAGVPLSPVVSYGNLVFVSGIPPINPTTGQVEIAPIGEQTRLCIENVKLCLEAAGSSLENVLKVTILITNAAYYDLVNEVYGQYFPQNPPARTFCTVASWPWPFDIEIECVAHRD